MREVAACLQLQPVNPTTPSIPNQILRIIKHLPKRKAPSRDSIRNIDLRDLPLKAITHLTKITNVAFRFHYFPKTWKEANVISVPKPVKNPALPQDRRAISLLDTMSKVIDRTLYRKIYQALLCHIPDEQFAFLPGRDLTLQLLRFTEYITDKLNGHTQQPY
jgi:hypothetical protein